MAEPRPSEPEIGAGYSAPTRKSPPVDTETRLDALQKLVELAAADVQNSPEHAAALATLEECLSPDSRFRLAAWRQA